MGAQSYKILKRGDNRFVIADSDTGAVMDDAGGYGYKTAQKAQKAAWYLFKGGKEKIEATKKEAKDFWRAHKDFAREVNRAIEYNYKEIGYGEMDLDAEVSEWAAERGIMGFNPRYLEYL